MDIFIINMVYYWVNITTQTVNLGIMELVPDYLWLLYLVGHLGQPCGPLILEF